jgi:Uma2 family endonuclease
MGSLPEKSHRTQGTYSESEYFELETNGRLEFSHGFLEFLPILTIRHQRIAAFLFDTLQLFVTARNLGEVFFIGVRVRLWPGKYREPDVVFMNAEHADRITDDYWEGADLVMEVVSPSDEARRRDLTRKREEYAQAGIPEYWIVDPELGQITVLTLEDQIYVAHGEFKRGDQATSKLLPGFAVDVASALEPKR